MFFILLVAAVLPVMVGLVSLLFGGRFKTAWLYAYAVVGTIASAKNAIVLTRASQIISLQGGLKSEVEVSGELTLTKNSGQQNDE